MDHDTDTPLAKAQALDARIAKINALRKELALERARLRYPDIDTVSARVRAGELPTEDAAALLGVSVRQFRRIIVGGTKNTLALLELSQARQATVDHLAQQADLRRGLARRVLKGEMTVALAAEVGKCEAITIKRLVETLRGAADE